MTETSEGPSLRLTEACWPVFEFMTNFTRQIKYGSVPAPDQVRFEALSALRDATDLARNDPVTERLWEDRVKAMMVYALDYKMLNTDWEGRSYWFDNPFETDMDVLNHAETLGGEEFFRDCDEIQREYELAERRDRRDKYELAELLSLYFTCLRLGFQGQFHDRPQELADYTRRLFSRLPAYASTRDRHQMFPQAYKHNEEVKVNYNLGMSLTVVLLTFALIIGSWLAASRLAWRSAVKDISDTAAAWVDGVPTKSADATDD
ncbi:MAG: DotU family type IV/VI secretion system protein [Phycisphaerales bacterium]|nr:MAG: DotU family type IV/VI secretion system protein [Phycisphaerales bacterium]